MNERPISAANTMGDSGTVGTGRSRCSGWVVDAAVTGLPPPCVTGEACGALAAWVTTAGRVAAETGVVTEERLSGAKFPPLTADTANDIILSLSENLDTLEYGLVH